MVSLPETAATWASSRGRKSSRRGLVRRCRAWRHSSAERPRAAMRTRACVTIGAGGLHLDLVELPAHVAPTECERDVTMLSELRIGAVAIDLQDAAESCEMLGRACGRAHRRSAASHPTST